MTDHERGGPVDMRDIRALHRRLDVYEAEALQWARAFGERIDAEKIARSLEIGEVAVALVRVEANQKTMLGYLERSVEIPAVPGVVTRMAARLEVRPRVLHMIFACLTIAVLSASVAACSVVAITQGALP